MQTASAHSHFVVLLCVQGFNCRNPASCNEDEMAESARGARKMGIMMIQKHCQPHGLSALHLLDVEILPGLPWLFPVLMPMLGQQMRAHLECR